MPKPARARRPASDARTRKMRAVLAACRRLGLDGEARKDLQRDVVGVASMADMTEGQLGRLLDHLNRDYKGTNPERPHVAKIKALWWSLYWLGAVDEPSDKALSTFVKRQTGIAALRFLDHTKSSSVIEALKDWLRREGVAWKTAAEMDAAARTSAAEQDWSAAQWDRAAVIDELGRRLFKAGLVVDEIAYAATALMIAPTLPAWSAREMDDVIRLLGRKWRHEGRAQ